MEQESNLVTSSVTTTTNTELSGTNEDSSLALPSVKEVYCCPYSSCNFSTAWKSSLNMHMKTHTDERPWQCALCNKHFKLKHHLKHHILTHSQHKLLKCNLCDYRCNDSHSLQRHKVNRHRFPVKRPAAKKYSLPTMVSLPSMESFNSTGNNFISSFLDRQNISSPTNASNPLSIVPESLLSSPGSSSLRSATNFSSINQMLLQQQQNLKASKALKLRNVRSVSDSFTPSFARRTSSFENDSLIDLVDDSDKTNNSRASVSPADSLPVTVKEETSRDLESPASSLQKTPNSQVSFDYLHGNRSSVDLTASKSPSALEKRRSLSSGREQHSPVFVEQQDVSTGAILNNKVQACARSANTAWKCSHCDIIFPDNIMYGLHMGCHSVGNPFQCNICGMKCKNSHDFVFHFTIGKHLS